VGGTGTAGVSIYFGITGGRDCRDIAPHFREAHVDQDPEIIRADRYYFRALAFYVAQRPAKANSVLKFKTGKACLWFRHQVDGKSLSVALSKRFSARREFDKWPTMSPFSL
jgi:hypothetical protein